MKTNLSLLIVFILALSACNTPEGATSRVYNDDIYYSSKDAKADKEKKLIAAAEKQKADEAAQKAADEEASQKKQSPTTEDYYTKKEQSTTDGNGNTYNTTNNYYDEPFDYDNYYDDEYAVRLRRFHHNCGNYGYYDNYYTNSYWYTGNPYNYGSSIYMGYNFWGPSYSAFTYNPSFSWYSGMGWGYDPYYNPWGGGYGYDPYNYGYSYGYGYDPYGYSAGYNAGYWNGYYNGYNNNYFNSYDNNSYYYGPRHTTGSTGRGSAQPTLAHRYMDAMEVEASASGTVGNRLNGNDGKNGTTGAGINPAYMNSSNPSNFTSKPTINNANGPINPANAKPVISSTAPTLDHGNQKPSNEFKPIVSDEYYVPAQKPNPVYEKPVYEQSKPFNEQPTYEKPKPVYEQPKPVYEQPVEKPKPHIEQPSPRNDPPRNDPPRFEAPKSVSPAPQNNNIKNNSTPSTPPRRR